MNRTPDISPRRAARAPHIALSIAVGLALAGCAGSGSTGAGGAPATPSPAASMSPTETSGENSAVDVGEVLALGEAALTPRQSRMTVFSFEPADRTTRAPAGSSWYAADIEFCMASTVKSIVPIETIRDEFGMQTEGGQFQRPDPAYGSPDEIYSEPGRTIVADECVRGLVVFGVPDDDPAEFTGLYVQGTLRWSVGG